MRLLPFPLPALLAAALVLAAACPRVPGQEVRDQNTSGAPRRAVKAPPADDAILASQGMAAFEKQDYATAITRFGQAISQNPGDISSRFYLALSLSLTGKDAASLSHYEKLAEAQPEIYEIRVNYAQALANTKHFEEAAAQLAKAEQLKPAQPKTVELLTAVGLAELAAGDEAGATRRFEAVLALQPANAEAQLGMGKARLKAGDKAGAETWIRKAAEANPAAKRELLQLAAVYERDGNFDKAVELYREFPGDSMAQERIGELLLEQGKAKEAIAALEASAKAEPTFENRQRLAVAYLRSGEEAKAAATMQAAVEAEPGNAEAHSVYGRILRDSRQFGPAAGEFAQAIKLNPKDTTAWSEFAGVAVLAEQYQAALNALAQLEKLGGLKPGHHYLRAIILDKFQNDQQAIAEYELFLASSNGQNKDEEFKARQRLRMLMNRKKR
ncbi:MAG: tetratricopeptide repeat protein [Bryobacterales bacterium]|nr:tetratricopeptide repeat protein [Bryobacterales bacterium]